MPNLKQVLLLTMILIQGMSVKGCGIEREIFVEWMNQVMNPVNALLVVDVQNDFINGTLALKDGPANQDGADVIPALNQMLNNVHFDAVIYSYDWHPLNHISFIENVHERTVLNTSSVSAEDAQVFDTVIFAGPPAVEQKLWPAHCVQDTWGAELHPDLKIVENHVRINKGTNPDIDSYSVFSDNQRLSQTPLMSELQQRNITDVYVGGLAYDVCVGWTALDALDLGFRTVVVEDASRGLNEADILATRRTLKDRGAVIVSSDQVEAMVTGSDRRQELGLFVARRIAQRRDVNKDRLSKHWWRRCTFGRR